MQQMFIFVLVSRSQHHTVTKPQPRLYPVDSNKNPEKSLCANYSVLKRHHRPTKGISHEIAWLRRWDKIIHSQLSVSWGFTSAATRQSVSTNFTHLTYNCKVEDVKHVLFICPFCYSCSCHHWPDRPDHEGAHVTADNISHHTSTSKCTWGQTAQFSDTFTYAACSFLCPVE